MYETCLAALLEQENEWTGKPPPQQQQQLQQDRQLQQQQPSSPAAADVVKDETEIDESKAKE